MMISETYSGGLSSSIYTSANKYSYQRFKRGDLMGADYVCIFPEQRIFVRVSLSELDVGLCSEDLLSKFIQYIYVTQEESEVLTFKETGTGIQRRNVIKDSEILPEFQDIMSDWASWIFNLEPEKIPKNTIKVIEQFHSFLNRITRLKLQGALGIYLEKTEAEAYIEQISKAC